MWSHAHQHDDTLSDENDDEPEVTIAALLGPVNQCEDAGCYNDGVDVRVGVSVGAVVGVGVSGQA